MNLTERAVMWKERRDLYSEFAYIARERGSSSVAEKMESTAQMAFEKWLDIKAELGKRNA